MGKQAWAKIKQFGGGVRNVLPVCLALLTIFWIFFATVIWPIENTRNIRDTFKLDDNHTLEIWRPQVVPLEAPVDLYFALHQQGASGQLPTLQVNVPEDLVVFSPLLNPLVGQVTLVFNESNSEKRQAIQVANAKQRGGLGTTSLSIRINRINRKQGEGMGQEESKEVGKIDIQVEQTWRGVLRQAGGGGSSIPLGPLITLVTSLGTLLDQYLKQVREEKEKSEKAAKEKEQERAHQAVESLSKIRQAFQAKNLETAEKNLLQIEQRALEAYLEVDELVLARQLLQLARGNISSFSFERLPQEWLEAAAGAILYAAQHNPTDRPGLEKLMRSFPADKLKDTNLKEEWQAVSDNIGVGIPSQAREWPRPTPKPWPVFVLPPSADIKSNPFLYERAEEEEGYLFAHPKGLFWSDHPAVQALEEQRSIWITGESGSGKTALALALGKYVLGDTVFAEKGFGCYFKGLPSITEIRRALENRLLDVILQSPSYLPLGEDQHRLLAEVLLMDLPASLVLSHIEQSISKSDWNWLKEAQNDTRRVIWQAEARSRLRLLEEAVRKDNSPLPEPVWPKAWSAAIRFLGFDIRTRLAFDLDASPSAQQESGVLDTLARWTEYGIHTLVFSLPNKHLEWALAGWTSHLNLSWDEADISKMAKWRWEQVYPERRFETLFENSDAETFLFQQAQGNPARLIRLWNLLVRRGITLPITRTQIESAAKSL